MRTVRKGEISPYLQSTAFYQALEEGWGEEFELPADCCKADATLRSLDDVRELIATIRFWGIEGIPKELIEYTISDTKALCRPVFEEAENDLRYLKVLNKIQATPKEQHMDEAMRGGELQIVQYLHDNGWSWSEKSMEFAAANGHLKCMQFAHEHGCAWTEGTFIRAAGKGHLECLKYAVENGCPKDTVTFSKTVGNPYYREVILVKKFGRIRELGACAYAAYNGHLEVLQYFHSNGLSQWTHTTCACAAAAGHLDCLKYAHENGCPFDGIIATTVAAANKHRACLDYALEQGCPYGSQVIDLMFWDDHSDIDKWLHQLCETQGTCSVVLMLLLFNELRVAVFVVDWGLCAVIIYYAFVVVLYLIKLVGLLLFKLIWYLLALLCALFTHVLFTIRW